MKEFKLDPFQANSTECMYITELYIFDTYTQYFNLCVQANTHLQDHSM